MIKQIMTVMLLLAANLNAMPAQSAPTGRVADEGGVYLQIEGAELASPAIPIGNLILMPRETRTITLTYRPTAEERSQIERVVWDGAASRGEGYEGYAAVLEVAGVGNYQVGLHVRFVADHDLSGPGQIREVDRTFQLRVEDIAAASVRTVIEYPGTIRTPPVDLDGNFRVDGQDLSKFWEGYGSVRGRAGYASLGDWDGNGVVELEDLVRFFDAYGGWKGREVGPNYGGGRVYPLTVKPNPHGFSVPTPIYSAHTEPGGFESWIEWRVDGATMETGSVFSRKFDTPGQYEVRSGVFEAGTEMQDARTLEIYRTSVSAFGGGAPLTDGVTYAFEARTEPPGYEDYVTWGAATLYGMVTPAYGRGRTYSVRFDGTWGPLPDDPTRSFQWLGVQADNAYLNQDQKGVTINNCAPATGGKGTTITINGAGFGNNPDDICMVLMPQKSVAARAFFANDGTIMAKVGAVRPAAAAGMWGIARGHGRTFSIPAFGVANGIPNAWAFIGDFGPAFDAACATTFTPTPDPGGATFYAWSTSIPCCPGGCCPLHDGFSPDSPTTVFQISIGPFTNVIYPPGTKIDVDLHFNCDPGSVHHDVFCPQIVLNANSTNVQVAAAIAAALNASFTAVGDPSVASTSGATVLVTTPANCKIDNASIGGSINIM